jgi:hypothetical protein
MPKRTKESYIRAGKLGAKRRWSGPQNLSVKDRFWTKVKIGSKTDCWPWKMIKNDRYGMFRFYNRRLIASHRVAYELVFGPIPDGLHVCHKCDFRPCCNPDHLFLGTAKDNLGDAMKKGRMSIGERHGNAKLTDFKVRTILALLKQGVPQSKLARRFAVSQSVICDINRRRAWKHI